MRLNELIAGILGDIAVQVVGDTFNKLKRTAELAADPMPPNATDMFVILKPRKDWPNPELPKEELVSRIEGNLAKIPGNAYEITQPIQMRFNELIAGVRGDIAVKGFGDDFNQLNRTAEQIAAALRKTQGAADVKVEQR